MPSTFSPAESAHANLLSLCPIVPNAIVSKPLLDTDGTRQILFALDRGQQLTEHTATHPATVHILSGQLSFSTPTSPPPTTRTLNPHDWILLTAAQPHALTALEPTHFLLTLLKR